MTRLIFDDRNAGRRWPTWRHWKEWGPFIIVALICVTLLVVLTFTSPVFRPLPVPAARSARSPLDRLAELVGFVQDSGFVRDSVEQSQVESAELDASANDSS